ncbi:MAG: hypothetical protein FWB75_01935 [Oscillospiraceae bacterium]|nr:hypothetical protein [Oscillospiraceae bacterium]
MQKEYLVIQTGEEYTIAEWNESFKALNEADGIYNHIFWKTEEEAKAAADALNEYEGKNLKEFIERNCM